MGYHLYDRGVSKDTKYLDQIIEEQIEVGGTIVRVYKYLGPKPENPSQEPSITDIQDPVFMENHSRVYDGNVYEMWAHTQISDLNLELLQFGISLGSNNPVITLHYGAMIERFGRKIIAGDVIELEFYKDYDMLNEADNPINRFYVVASADRPAEGYDPMYRSHLWRLITEPLPNSPEYEDILGDPKDPDSLGNQLSSYEKELAIMDALVAEADAEVPFTGVNTHQLWYDMSKKGFVAFNNTVVMAQGDDVVPPNQNPEDVQYGIAFPSSPNNGDFFLRTDFDPAILYQYQDSIWYRQEYEWRREVTGPNRTLSDFLNDITENKFQDGKTQKARQAITRAVKAKTDYKKPWKS